MQKVIHLATTLAERDRCIFKVYDLKYSPEAQASIAIWAYCTISAMNTSLMTKFINPPPPVAKSHIKKPRHAHYNGF
jgi:hypothetical protein